ncbi:hypothetical protein Rhow_001316 [Rhodococcus wratislaviensis]|uniref:Uncharacterized protein n=1 Tax=Rhodococcus wratislaviensis TaxID=44752 RepID=A0A402C3X7_RHOWR|nr:hypothetical protein Rhow_001316 [Rhodococcus wratislaviensis]
MGIGSPSIRRKFGRSLIAACGAWIVIAGHRGRQQGEENTAILHFTGQHRSIGQCVEKVVVFGE